MARTLIQIKQQIQALEKEAENVKPKEIAGVIERMKSAIEFYGLTPADLFSGSKAKKLAGSRGASVVAFKKTRKKKMAVAKFKDPSSDKTWTGHGKRPGWFVQAIAGGKKPEDLAA